MELTCCDFTIGSHCSFLIPHPMVKALYPKKKIVTQESMEQRSSPSTILLVAKYRNAERSRHPGASYHRSIVGMFIMCIVKGIPSEQLM
jgi:hypothetical protein